MKPTYFTDLVKAEVLMCELVADFNLPIITVNKLFSTLKKMFQDSKIAKGICPIDELMIVMSNCYMSL